MQARRAFALKYLGVALASALIVSPVRAENLLMNAHMAFGNAAVVVVTDTDEANESGFAINNLAASGSEYQTVREVRVFGVPTQIAEVLRYCLTDTLCDPDKTVSNNRRSLLSDSTNYYADVNTTAPVSLTNSYKGNVGVTVVYL